MILKWAYFAIVLAAVTTLNFGFKPFHLSNLDWIHTTHDGLTYSLPSTHESDYKLQYSTHYFVTGKFFDAFKEAIAIKESQGQYHLVNSFGYMGKYQFGKAALRAVGIQDYNGFLKNPELQEKAFVALCAKNKWELRNEIEKYNGKTIGGVKITESGILAGAHLLGAGSVKKFLRSNGNVRIKDGYGTSLRSYLRNYAGYQTSHIKPQANPVVRI